MKFESTSVFVIRQKSTNSLLKFGSKCAWISAHAAANAFNFHMKIFYPELENTKNSLIWHLPDFVIEEIK